MGSNQTTPNSPSLGTRLIKALTQQELGQLLEALLAALPPESQGKALEPLTSNTQAIVQQLLKLPSAQVVDSHPPVPIVSLAKQDQTWNQLWRKWDKLVNEASDEDSRYIEQEEEWEPPYFDETAFAEDLETIGAQMLPLLTIAFENGFSPDSGFIPPLLEAEAAMGENLEEWMGFPESLPLESRLTQCVLQWEWMVVQDQEKDSFYLAEKLRRYEQEFSLVELDSNIVIDFFNQLPESDQRCLLTGLTRAKDSPLWQDELEDADSDWYYIYLNLAEKFDPNSYLNNLRQTISQRWEHGLAVIEALLAEENYEQGEAVIEETFNSLLRTPPDQKTWKPETSLLIATGRVHHQVGGNNLDQLLDYYQTVAKALKQTERIKALEVQKIAINEYFNWSALFTAFKEVSLTPSTRNALFISWRNYVGQRSKRLADSGYGYRQPSKAQDSWWVLWLIDSVADE